jgi:hypothetical protein
VIHIWSTRLERSLPLALATLFVAVVSSGCAGPTAAIMPEVGTPASVKTTGESATDVSAPLASDPKHPCKRRSDHEDLATPEAAVHLYVDSLAANDFACALYAYAAHEHAAGGDFTSLVRWVGFLSPSVQNAPAEYPMFVEMNELRAKAKMAEATKFFVYLLLADTDPRGVQTVDSDEQIHAFIRAVDPARLAPLKVLRIDQARQSITNSPRGQALLKDFAAREAADEATERVALYDLSGRLFWSGFRLCRYGKAWKILELASTSAGPQGEVGKTTAAEYEARVQ